MCSRCVGTSGAGSVAEALAEEGVTKPITQPGEQRPASPAPIFYVTQVGQTCCRNALGCPGAQMDNDFQRLQGSDRCCYHARLCAARMLCCLPFFALLVLGVVCLPMLIVSLPIWLAMSACFGTPGPTLGRSRADQQAFGVSRFTDGELHRWKVAVMWLPGGIFVCALGAVICAAAIALIAIAIAGFVATAVASIPTAVLVLILKSDPPTNWLLFIIVCGWPVSLPLFLGTLPLWCPFLCCLFNGVFSDDGVFGD